MMMTKSKSSRLAAAFHATPPPVRLRQPPKAVSPSTAPWTCGVHPRVRRSALQASSSPPSPPPSSSQPPRSPDPATARRPPPLPLAASGIRRGQQRLSYAQLLEHAAEAILALAAAPPSASNSGRPMSTRLTVDFPPERSETRAGTLVSRFENNLNFVQSLAERFGASPAECLPLGPRVEIRDNVNPQGGGEYLTDDECLVGVRVPRARAAATAGRSLVLLLNAGVDAGTLREAQTHDTDADGVVVLVNCGLDRVSWFSKIGFRDYIDSFETAYYLKAIPAGGWLLKCGKAPWTVFAYIDDGLSVISQSDDRPALVDVEASVRLAVAGLS